VEGFGGVGGAGRAGLLDVFEDEVADAARFEGAGGLEEFEFEEDATVC